MSFTKIITVALPLSDISISPLTFKKIGRLFTSSIAIFSADHNDSGPKEKLENLAFFSATPSKGCATFALKKVASDYGYLHGEEANFLYNDFYVDNSLKSLV